MIKKGFTLAEVLTTLMVIGVVAAMTIPTLMNSTQEQTARTATKKAMSVLSQGAQLIVASDVDCTFADSNNPLSAELAKCMANVMAGTRIAGSDGENRIKTNDGMEYDFIVPSDATGSDLGMVCGTDFGQYNGAGNCLVVVDVMAGKGSSIPIAGNPYAYTKAAGLNNTPETATDIVAFGLSSQGARPYGLNGQTSERGAFKYVYGDSQAVPELNFCCQQTKDASGAYQQITACAAGTTNAGKIACKAKASTTACDAASGEQTVQVGNYVDSCN